LPNHTKVISFPTPALWSFFDYVEAGTNRIEGWYQGLSQEGMDAFDALLKNTQKIQDHLQWGGFKFLKGKPKEERIWQLDFRADKRQYRLLGVFGSVRKQAVLILGCYHKGESYTPKEALETACKRAKALREGRATTYGRTIKDDL
jgi:phage-related protein